MAAATAATGPTYPVAATLTAAETHQAAQEAISLLIPALIREAWPLLNPHDIKGTLPAFTAAVKAVVQRYGKASGVAALNYYKRERLAAGVTSPVKLHMAPSPADHVIEQAVKGAVTVLYGPVTPEAEQAALRDITNAAQDLVAAQQHDTIAGALDGDREAKGYVRVTEQGACSFCTMLALRGPVYKSADSFKQSNAHFKGAEGKVKVHNNCHCSLQPIFTAYEPSARMRRMQQLWDEATKNRSGEDARVAFRQRLEGRDVTGTTGPRDDKGQLIDLVSKPLGKDPSKDRVQAAIDAVSKLSDTDWKRKRLERLRKQLAAVGG